MFQFSFSSAIVFFLISSMRCFQFFMILTDCRVILQSVCIIIVSGVMLLIFIVSIACTGECLLLFGADTFIFQFAIQKVKDQDI